MDMNELLRQHQIALINEARRNSEAATSRSWIVRHYERRIKKMRVDLGVAQY